MHTLTPPSIMLLVALVCAPVAEAGPIIYFDSYRSLNANGTVQDTTAAGAWSAHVPTSITRSQQSFIGQHLVDAQGHPYERISANGVLNAAVFEGANFFSTDLFTTFQLDRQYDTDLRVSLSARNDGYAEGYLFDHNTQTMLAQGTMDAGGMRLLYEGVLQPGLYSYFLMAQIDTTGGTGFNDHHAQFAGDLTFQEFTPVPEPGTMTLLGLGLAAAWRRRRTMTVKA